MVSEVFLDYHNWEGRGHAAGIPWEEAREAFKSSSECRMAPPIKEPAPNANRAKVLKP